MVIALRLLLTVVLCYGVYTETGIWTTLAVALLFGYTELKTFIERNRGSENPADAQVQEGHDRSGL